MGSALIRGMISSGITSGSEITISSGSSDSAKQSATLLGTKWADSNAEAVRDADAVFLCVKPVKAIGVVSEIAGDLVGKLLISTVAGIRAADLLAASGNSEIRVIRSMPNTAVRLRKGVIAVARDPSASADDRELAMRIFASVGTALEVKEEDLDTITAVSGSGPAFALLVLEAMIDEAVESGLDRDSATILAAGALAGASALVSETGEKPATLRQEITSPNGTTAAGLAVLETSETYLAFRSAVRAAKNRSTELSKNQ